MPQPLKVLLVEDNPDDAKMVLRELKRGGFEPISQRVDTEAAFLGSLGGDLNFILSDYAMPQFSGLRALELLKKSGLEIPFILISGTIGEDIAVEAMKLGATDYLLKDRLTRLGPAVRRALEEVEERNQRRQIEKQFIEAQKMEVIGQLAGGVAHDFNNVLAVIMVYCELMIQQPASEDELKDYVETVMSTAKRAAGLTRQLLIFSRKQVVQQVVLQINEVVTDLEAMLRRLIDERIQLKIVPGQEIGHIKADSGYVGQVVMNLVVNARDAMPNGGLLTVATSNVTLDEAGARAHAGTVPGEYVMLSVTDTGTGMSEEVKARIFEAFFTTKPKGKGTGLGLATCQSILQQLGGFIEVESELGRGTTFKIYFPRVDQPLAVVTRAEGGPARRGSETILIVEDEPSLRQLAGNLLKDRGYNVLTASNGQEALNLARNHKGPQIRMVITDVIMPVMDGKVMAEWLKSDNPTLKVLFTSGYTDDAITAHGVLEKGVEFLSKPYTAATLTGKVREMLDQS
jgi:two-component system, cell cycle sensor histidine kinase and response regulator CckA